jgi:hypothetical protein
MSRRRRGKRLIVVVGVHLHLCSIPSDDDGGEREEGGGD